MAKKMIRITGTCHIELSDGSTHERYVHYLTHTGKSAIDRRLGLWRRASWRLADEIKALGKWDGLVIVGIRTTEYTSAPYGRG